MLSVVTMQTKRNESEIGVICSEFPDLWIKTEGSRGKDSLRYKRSFRYNRVRYRGSLLYYYYYYYYYFITSQVYRSVYYLEYCIIVLVS